MSKELYLKYFVIKMNQAIDFKRLVQELEKYVEQKYIIGKDLAECILEAMM